MKLKLISIIALLISLFFYNDAVAQFYDSRNFYLYIEVGQTLESSSKINYIHFDSSGNLYSGSIEKNTAIKLNQEDILDEYAINKSHSYKYCSNTSTSRYEVYKEARTETRPYTGQWYPGCPMWESVSLGGYWFRAFSLDRSEMITWHTTRNSEEAKSRKHYKRIDPSELVKKVVVYDFL